MDSVTLDIVESTFDGISFSDQTPLEDGIEQSCLAFIDENRFIIAGGIIDGSPSSSVFLHDLTDGTISRSKVLICILIIEINEISIILNRLRDMTFPTNAHSCGVVIPEDGSSPKFVAAGGTGLPPFGTVQIYYVEDDSWLLGNYK